MHTILKDDIRSQAELREHYEIEKSLAKKLRKASKQERVVLYAKLYDELFQRVPHHSQLLLKNDALVQEKRVKNKMRLLGRFLRPTMNFLEMGAGDYGLSRVAALRVAKVYAVDVSLEIGRGVLLPSNVKPILSDGTTLPLHDSSMDFVYSDQLMEHLHEDDAKTQLESIFRVLAPTGGYMCITPNAFSGPHDISRHFSDKAEGFHLKEYMIGELCSLFRTVGFRSFFLYAGGKGFYLRIPLFCGIFFEKILATLPKKMARKIASFTLFRAILGINIIAWK